MEIQKYRFDYKNKIIGNSLLLNADCFGWLGRVKEDSFHAVVTDPPYGVKEYNLDQIEKRHNGNGGVWRIPPSFDGSDRSPLPRFTALNNREREIIRDFFNKWAKLIQKVLRPGGHVLVASNAFLSQMVFSSIVDGGLEFRGELIRLVRTFRGGDRPKNAEKEFSGVCSLPRSCYEPWGIFRKPIPSGMTVGECLRTYGTGGFRRINSEQPFSDVIESERTAKIEKEIADHPSLKPQSFLRQIVRAVLPLGHGIILDPFMGSGSTVAACEAMGLHCIGVERHLPYFEMSLRAIPDLASLAVEMENVGLFNEELCIPS